MRSLKQQHPQLLDRLAEAGTPWEIERVARLLWKATKNDRRDHHQAILRACNARAGAIAPTCRRGNLFAYRLDRGQGCSRSFQVDGEVYKTGTWGNGAGYRWCMGAFEGWYKAKLRAGGLRSSRKIKDIVDWTVEGYRWRALRLLGE